MAGQTHILYHMYTMQTVGALKIKGPEINAFIVTVILRAESDANKTLSGNIFTPQINIYPAVCKRHTFQPSVALQTQCGPVGTFCYMNRAIRGILLYRCDLAVAEHLNKVIMDRLGF